MAGEDAPEGEDRTEAATPRRLEKAREEGKVALSRELSGWAALLAATLAAWMALPPMGRELMRGMKGVLGHAHLLSPAEALQGLLGLGALAVLPVAGAAAAAALLVTLVQTGGLVSARALTPDLGKLNPWAGLKRLFGLEALAEFLRTLLKLGLVGAALWSSAGDLAALGRVLQEPAGRLLGTVGEAALRLMGAALGAFAVIAVLDLAWVRWRHARDLRMSRQELKEDAKESEGDPHRRARMREIRRQRSKRRMMAAVPQAAVVVTNPTHFAVALAYAGGEAAPRVVAKGADAVAARIRAAAEAAGVPLVSNPPLARALFRVELDAEIPPEHYQAVAEIIAYVWRLRGRRAR